MFKSEFKIAGPSSFRNLHFSLLAVAIGLGLWVPLAGAAVKIWDGSANGNWSTGANWSGDTAPLNGDELIFPGALNLLNTNNIINRSFLSITFTANGYTIRGNSVTITSADGLGSEQAAGVNNVEIPITLSVPQTFDCLFAAASLTISGNITNNGNLLTVSGAGDIMINGVISGAGGLTKSGAGTLLLAGSVNNTYGGLTTVNGGTLQLNDTLSATAMVPGDVTISSGVLLLAEGNQIANTSDVTVNGTGLFNLNGFNEAIATLTLTAGGDVTTGIGTLTNGNVTVSSASAVATISGNLDLGGALRTFNIASGGANPELNISAIISNGSITKTGTGNMQLSGANTYAGLTTISAGFIELANATGLGSTTSGTTLDGGSLSVEGVSVVGEPLTNNSTLSIFESTGAAGWSGNIVLNSQLDVLVFGAGGTFNLSGVISGFGALTKGEIGTLIYDGTSINTYTGTTTVNAGTLLLSRSGAGLNNAILGPLTIGDSAGGANADVVRLEGGIQLATAVAVTITSSGLFDLNNITESFGSLAGSGNVTLGSGTINPGLDNTSTTFSGVINGTGGLIKSGTGTMTLSGTNLYTGTTAANAGTLLVNGSQQQSPVTVSASGTLGGSGTVGNINNTAGGIVAPGSSPAILTCSNVIFSGVSSDFTVELNGPTAGTNYDQLNVRGTASLGGSTLNLSIGGGFVPLEGQSFMILTNDGAEAITGTFAGLAEGASASAGALKFRISYVGGSGNDVTLIFTNLPLKGITGVVTSGNGNNVIEPNECNNLNLVITNTSGGIITGIAATLSTTTPGVIVTQPNSNYPNIPANGHGTNTTPFQISTLSSFACGATIELVLTVTSSVGNFASIFTLPSGSPGSAVRFDNNTFTAIPDLNFINSTSVVSGITTPVKKVTVSLHLAHPTDGDLDITLIGPDGTAVPLSSGNGGTGNDYGTDCADGLRTLFDDAAGTSITAGTAPFVGSFRPEGTLATFIGKTGADVNGDWVLRIEDDFAPDGGTLRCWSLFIAPSACNDGGGACVFCAGTVSGSITADDSVQTGRLTRFLPETTCAAPTSCSVSNAGPLHYDAYSFINTSTNAVCVTVAMTNGCGPQMFSVAYSNSFNPVSLCDNYLADQGGSAVGNTYSFSVSAGATFVVVVHEVTANNGCDYTLTVTGLSCEPPTLNIASVPPDKVRLFWPTFAAGYLLESTNNLPITPSAIWQTVTNQPIVNGGNYNVTNDVSNTNQFYRLRKPL